MDYEPLPIISNDFVRIVIPLIDTVQYSIDIIVYDWRYYKNEPACAVSLFNNSIARACRRGVRVRCLVQNGAILEYLKILGCDARKLPTGRILHTKLLILDNSGTIIGSHNYTKHAFESNFEASIFVKIPAENNAFVQYFNNLFGL